MSHTCPPPPICKSILDAVGNTPLVEIEPGIWAKCEFMNPSGSIKARMAKYMIDHAEREGKLKPGDTIVEATSGNTGNALSMIAAVKGYKMLVLMPDGYSNERAGISRAYGAELEYIGHFQVNEALEKARALGKEDGYFCPQQFDNDWNVAENRDWLAPEILAQMPDGLKIDAVVQGVGTGGTLIGVAQGLRKDHNPLLKAYAMEPEESQTLACCLVGDHKIEGISDGFEPTLYTRYRSEVDDVVSVNSEVAVAEMKALASKKGLLVGPSSGANVWAAKQLKEEHPEFKNILTFLCDEGEKYLLQHYITEMRGAKALNPLEN